MEVAREDRAHPTFPALLAGLQAGMVAALWMLAWLGVSAAWHRESFWTAENLFATTFFGARAIRTGFSGTTLSGLALFLLVYSILGSLYAGVVRDRFPRLRLVLASIAVAVAWYYLFFQVICRAVSPLVTLLHATQSTIWGHILYGAILARFPRYLQH